MTPVVGGGRRARGYVLISVKADVSVVNNFAMGEDIARKSCTGAPQLSKYNNL